MMQSAITATTSQRLLRAKFFDALRKLTRLQFGIDHHEQDQGRDDGAPELADVPAQAPSGVSNLAVRIARRCIPLTL